MPEFVISLNSSHVVQNGLNNHLKFPFKAGGFKVPRGSKMAISNAVIPYSFFNVSGGQYNNNSLGYYWPNGTFNLVSFPDGFYTTDSINNFLQQYMIAKFQYLTNTTTGQNMYFIQIVTNQTYYSNQILLFPVPMTLPAGFTAPSGFPYAVSSATTPQVNFPSTKSMGSLLGFTTGTYPNTPTTLSNNVLSNSIPNACPVNAIVLRSNLINNNCGQISDMLDSFAINNTSFGSNITYQPPWAKYVSIVEGVYSSINITLVDQNLQNIKFNDNNLLLSILIVTPEKHQEITYETPTPTPPPNKLLINSDTLFR